MLPGVIGAETSSYLGNGRTPSGTEPVPSRNAGSPAATISGAGWPAFTQRTLLAAGSTIT